MNLLISLNGIGSVRKILVSGFKLGATLKIVSWGNLRERHSQVGSLAGAAHL